MKLVLYNIFLFLYQLSATVFSLFNDKAKKWIDGRKDWEAHVRSTLIPGEKRIWVHCSSMGEFEQAIPVIEALKKAFSQYKILVTFFSPSGYEACKNSGTPDYIFYLPHDSKRNAEKFIHIVSPTLVIFVKYEFWYYYLAQLKIQRIPAILVSGAFRNGQVFFRRYGRFFREMLHCFNYFFLQDEESERLLSKIGIVKNIIISGDTRYDRVAKIARSISPIPAIEKFKGLNKILIAGSTWPGDENILKDCIGILPDDWKLILVPHEIGGVHINKIQSLFPDDSILFTELDAAKNSEHKKILIIDNIGMLSRLYAYGNIAFVGGGFQKGGIHNILEPAVFGLPVIIGPVYEKFVEAKQMVALHYVFPVNDSAECSTILKKLISDESYRTKLGISIKRYMQQQVGAAPIIIDRLKETKWLG